MTEPCDAAAQWFWDPATRAYHRHGVRGAAEAHRSSRQANVCLAIPANAVCLTVAMADTWIQHCMVSEESDQKLTTDMVSEEPPERMEAREPRLDSRRGLFFFLRTMVASQILGSSSSSSSSNRGASEAVGMWLGMPTLGVEASSGPCPVGLHQGHAPSETRSFPLLFHAEAMSPCEAEWPPTWRGQNEQKEALTLQEGPWCHATAGRFLSLASHVRLHLQCTPSRRGSKSRIMGFPVHGSIHGSMPHQPGPPHPHTQQCL